jgi:N-acetylglutamate synthase-like GNAT family acetyltransferase
MDVRGRRRRRKRHDDDPARNDRAGRDVDGGLRSRARTALDALKHRQGHRADFGCGDLDGRGRLCACRMDRAAGVSAFGCCAHPGLEQFGSSVLLRSLVITSELRGTGIARELVAQLEDIARSFDQQEVCLLTTTAERFFGLASYERVSRDEVSGEVRLCRQFAATRRSRTPCCTERCASG